MDFEDILLEECAATNWQDPLRWHDN
jgi:hypothetical protein